MSSFWFTALDGFWARPAITPASRRQTTSNVRMSPSRYAVRDDHRDRGCTKQEALACARASATDGAVAGYPPRTVSRSVEHDLFRKPGSAFRDHARCLLNRLAVQGEIEAFALHLFLHAQADHDVDDLQDDERHHEVVDEHDADADALVDDLRGIALDQAGRAAVCLDREHAGEDRTGGAAERVHAEGVERVVVAEHVLEAGDAPVADHAGRSADQQRADRADEARGG